MPISQLKCLQHFAKIAFLSSFSFFKKRKERKKHFIHKSTKVSKVIRAKATLVKKNKAPL